MGAMPRKADSSCDVFVIFGITGDLAKVMTFHSLYRLEQRGLLDCPIVGVAVDDWSDDDLREHARAAIEGTGEKIDSRGLRPPCQAASPTFRATSRTTGPTSAWPSEIKDAKSPVFYLEIPPSLFGMVIKGLAGAELTADAAIVVEKPFGHDLDSARELAERAA